MNILKSQLDNNKNATSINLEFKQINDLSILLPLLSKFQFLKKLSLHGNRLKDLPEDLSSLNLLQTLNISNNLFPSFELILQPLQSLPNLRNLNCTIKSKDEIQIIHNRLPKLVTLNDETISRQIQKIFQKQQQRSDHLIKQQDLEQVAICYDKIRQIYRDKKLNYDQQLAMYFDENVESIMQDLSKKLKNQTSSSQGIIKTRVICSKYALIDLCFSKLINYFEITNSDILSIIQQIHDQQAYIFKQLLQIISWKNDKRQSYNGNQGDFKIKKQKLKDRQLQRIRKHRDVLLEDIKQLQKQNKNLLDKIYNNYGKSMKYNKNNIAFKTPQKYYQQNSSYKATEQNQQIPKNMKNLTIKQFKQIIDQILISKQKYDLKCFQLKNPRQTLQQYMYTYLNKKYGLKNLTIQWAMTIVYYIKKYNQQDNLVAIFGKIMRNQLSQKIYFKQKELRKKIEDNYKTLIKIKTNKLTHQIQSLFAEKSFIYIKQCQQIIRFMYTVDDANILMEKILDIKQFQRKSSKSQLSSQKARSIKYLDFIQIILEWNMKNEERNIKQFLYEFKKLDVDSDGIIDVRDLRKLLQKTKNISPQRIQIVMDLTNNFNKLTFSQLCQYHDNNWKILTQN